MSLRTIQRRIDRIEAERHPTGKPLVVLVAIEDSPDVCAAKESEAAADYERLHGFAPPELVVHVIDFGYRNSA